MAEFSTGSRLCSCVDPALSFLRKWATSADKGTIPIRKTNSSDHTYLDYRLRADLSSSHQAKLLANWIPLSIAQRNSVCRTTSVHVHTEEK
jgi:hypothetical protein